MSTIREEFGLMKYPEWFINKIINYRMFKNNELQRYLTTEEIAAKENCPVEGVEEILSRTSMIWTH